jgi:hypothetical protein
LKGCFFTLSPKINNFLMHLCFADYIKICRSNKYLNDCLILDSGIFSTRGCCTAKNVELNTSKTKVTIYRCFLNDLISTYIKSNGWMAVKDEVGSMLKRAIVAHLTYYTSIYVAELRRITKICFFFKFP